MITATFFEATVFEQRRIFFKTTNDESFFGSRQISRTRRVGRRFSILKIFVCVIKLQIFKNFGCGVAWNCSRQKSLIRGCIDRGDNWIDFPRGIFPDSHHDIHKLQCLGTHIFMSNLGITGNHENDGYNEGNKLNTNKTN